MIRNRLPALLAVILLAAMFALPFLLLSGCETLVSEDPSKKSAQDAAQVVAILQQQLPEILHRYAPATNPADLQAAVAAAVKAAMPVAQDPANHSASDAALQALPAVIQALQPVIAGAGGPWGSILGLLAAGAPGLLALLLHTKKSGQPPNAQQVLAQVLASLASAAPRNAPATIIPVQPAPTAPPAAPAST